MRYFILIFFASNVLFAIESQAAVLSAMVKQNVSVNGLLRQFYVHLPTSTNSVKKLPLLLVFHGGGGNPRQMARMTQFNQLADKYGFIVVYPQGLKGHWYDDRFLTSMPLPDSRVDDVGFVLKILEGVKKKYKIDSSRIFATGISNGGVFSQQLAVRASTKIKAIATVVAQLPGNFEKNFSADGKVSVLMINGTSDPLMPYQGGPVVITLSPKKRKSGKIKTRGNVLSTDRTIELWLKHNKLSGVLVQKSTLNRMSGDGTRILKSVWKKQASPYRVVLYEIVNGGHAWPGRKNMLPEKILGKVSMEIDASKVIWQFFSELE